MSSSLRAPQFILVIAALATVATSAPLEPVLSNSRDQVLSGGTVRILALANPAAIASASEFTLTLQFSSPSSMSTATTTVNLIPDNRSIAPEAVSFGPAASNDLVERTFDLLPLCARDAYCNAGVSVEVPINSLVAVSAIATITAPKGEVVPAAASLFVEFQQ